MGFDFAGIRLGDVFRLKCSDFKKDRLSYQMSEAKNLFRSQHLIREKVIIPIYTIQGA